MSGETYIPRRLKVCMYVLGNIHTQKVIGTLKVCMYVWGNIHTYKIIGMYVCLGS